MRLPMAKINCALGYVIFLSTCSIRGAQAPPAQVRMAANSTGLPEVHLRVDTSLVLVPVHASTKIGAPITDLTEANFRVFEDGAEQKVTYFAKQDAPVSVGLVFDSSGSMTHKIRRSAEAAAAFFKTANAGDEFFLIEFGERPKLMMPFTPDPDEIYRKLVQSKPFGRTSLIDAIHLALVHMKNARNARKAIVILSDGGDNRSRLTRGEIKSALLESDVQMYAMGVFDRDELAKHTAEEKNGPRLLDDLAAPTGGRVYRVDNLDDLESISSALGNALRNEYLLGYVPSNESRDGKYRKVKVKLVVSDGIPALNVSYRHGYYAPAQ
jgi:Ca-activated chloride channel family protein